MKGKEKALLLAAICGMGAQSVTAGEKPNVIMIIVDGMQSDRMSCAGRTEINTPAIDMMAEHGFRFSQAYCMFPLSTPSRYAMFTGMYPSDCNLRFNLENQSKVNAVDWEKLEETRMSALGNIFNDAGYDTFYGGTTSLASRTDINDPHQYGFNTVYSRERHEKLGTDAAALMKERQKTDKPYLMVLSFINPHNIGQFGDFLNRKDLKPEDITPKMKEGLDRLGKYAALLSGKDEREIFDSICPALPYNHEIMEGEPAGLPIPVSNYTEDEWKLLSWFYDRLVEEVDRNMKPVVDTYFENPDIRENTILVFISDHGEMAASHRREHKSVPYQEAQKVPLIFNGPGIECGICDSTTVINTGIDLLPTLCGLAGIDVPDGRPGEPLGRIMCGHREGPDRRYIFLEGPDWFQVLDSGRYKLTVLEDDGNPVILTDLREDPGELVNLAEKKEYSHIREHLLKVLDKELHSRGIEIRKY